MPTDKEKLNDIYARNVRIESKMMAIACKLGVDTSQGRAVRLVQDSVYIESMGVSLHDIEKAVKSTPRWAAMAHGQWHDFDVFLGSPGNADQVGSILIRK